jgi:hypothetical protein
MPQVPTAIVNGTFNADHHFRTLRYQQAGLRGTLAARPPLTSTTLLSKRAMSALPDYRQGSLADRAARFKICWCWVTTGVRWVPTGCLQAA